MVFVHAVFHNETSAAAAVEALLEAKFPVADISALMVNRSGVQELEPQHKTGMAPGAVLGAVFGAVGGALAVSGGLVLAGPVFLALEGVLAGGVLGTLAGTLGGLGFWKDDFVFPKQAFENGAVLIGVEADPARVEAASEALQRAGATDVRQSSKNEARVSAESQAVHAPRI